jgi:opacity protein-like surface antigen
MGVETMISEHWSVRAEYRYTDYGSDTESFLTGGTPTPNGDSVVAELGTTAHSFSIGIAYRF